MSNAQRLEAAREAVMRLLNKFESEPKSTIYDYEIRNIRRAFDALDAAERAPEPEGAEPFTGEQTAAIYEIASKCYRRDVSDAVSAIELHEARLSALEATAIRYDPSKARKSHPDKMPRSVVWTGSPASPPPSTPQAETGDFEAVWNRCSAYSFTGPKLITRENFYRAATEIARAAREAALDEAIVAAQPYGGTGIPRAINALRAERERGDAKP